MTRRFGVGSGVSRWSPMSLAPGLVLAVCLGSLTGRGAAGQTAPPGRATVVPAQNGKANPPARETAGEDPEKNPGQATPAPRATGGAAPAGGRKNRPAAPPVPPATMANVAYGTHPRQVLDFWKAESATPTPLVFVIHGGGWRGGDKEKGVAGLGVARLLKEGLSVVSINYRYTSQAPADGVEPPVRAPLHDAARALQFVRSRAREWNLDKTRIGATGGSAGACSSLWLAFHEDLANPESEDLVARESTRLSCAAVIGAQTTLDPALMKEWIPNSKYGGHAFGLGSFEQFLEQREALREWIAEYSPHAHVSAGDPPIWLFYNAPPAMGQEQKDPTHSANFGVKLQEICHQRGVSCELVYPGAEGVKHPRVVDYLVEQLTSRPEAGPAR